MSLLPITQTLSQAHIVRSHHLFVVGCRAALEGERVSQQLHAWLDLIFGHALRGPAAEAALNVELSRPQAAELRSRRRPQLFRSPHPRRLPRSCLADPQHAPVSWS